LRKKPVWIRAAELRESVEEMVMPSDAPADATKPRMEKAPTNAS
jgi:hypothetical protein